MLVVLHAGAGFHSPKNESIYKELITRVCENTSKRLEGGYSAVEAVVYAIRLLEEHPLTNAGISGSNFTVDGWVENDAALMTLDGFAAAGAVPMAHLAHSGSIHPSAISIAHKLYENNQKGVDVAGRQPPMFLVGEQCHEYARENQMDMICNGNSMITQEQLDRYHRHLGILSDAYADNQDSFQDTVGAIVIDGEGRIATGVSSGGISLKRRGRVGEAAMPGSGIYVCSSDTSIIAASLSGTGEQIMKTHFASTICNLGLESEMMGPFLGDVLRNRFIKTSILQKESLKHVGALVVKKTDDEIQVCWAHTTPSFCIGYISKNKVHFQISRLLVHQDLSVSTQSIR